MCPQSTPTTDTPNTIELADELTAHAQQLLSIAETATQLRVHHTFVRRLIRDGELPAIKFSARLWRIRQSEIDAWLDRSTTSRAS